MYLSLSKTMAKFGKLRLGLGIRITKKNAIFMLFVSFIVATFQLMWYMLVFMFWLMYVIFYGFFLGCKKIAEKIKERNSSK